MLLRWIKDSTSKLRKVFPCSSHKNSVNARLANHKHFSEFRSGEMAGFSDFSNAVNLRLRKHGRATFLSDGLYFSALFNHVLRVVFLGSEKQVIRINARRIVALVKNEKVLRNLSECKFPSNPVSKSRTVVHRKSTIAKGSILASSPNPALIFGCLLYLLPKSFTHRPSVLVPAELGNPLVVFDTSILAFPKSRFAANLTKNSRRIFDFHTLNESQAIGGCQC